MPLYPYPIAILLLLLCSYSQLCPHPATASPTFQSGPRPFCSRLPDTSTYYEYGRHTLACLAFTGDYHIGRSRLVQSACTHLFGAPRIWSNCLARLLCYSVLQAPVLQQLYSLHSLSLRFSRFVVASINGCIIRYIPIIHFGTHSRAVISQKQLLLLFAKCDP